MSHTLHLKPEITIDLPKDLTVVGISIDPFNRLGLLGVLPQFAMVCYADDVLTESLISDGLPVISLRRSDPAMVLEKTNTESILSTSQFIEEIRKLGRTDLFIYKNTQGTAEIANRLGFNLVANDYQLAEKIENKYQFRQLFKHTAVPPFRALKKVIVIKNKQKYYNELVSVLGQRLVLQDDVLSGGKGTYIINNLKDWLFALDQLENNDGGEWLVVSTFIAGVVGSVQVCITKYGPVWTGWQQQVIANPVLCNTAIGGVEQFCGGVWGNTKISNRLQKKIEVIVKDVASLLEHLGYKGIFGIDLIADPKQELMYVIEVNARVTGMTPPLTLMQKAESEIPLQLLHVLELGGYDYSVAVPKQLLLYHTIARCGSYLVMHNKLGTEISLRQSLKVGVYRYNSSGKFEWIRAGYDLSAIKGSNEFLLPDPPAPTTKIKPYQRILCLITKDIVVNQRGEISELFNKVIAQLEGRFV